MVGAWEISNAARDRLAPLAFSLDAGERGFKLELKPACATAFPSLKNVAAWAVRSERFGAALDSKVPSFSTL